MKKKLGKFSEKEFLELKSTGLLWELYPEAPENYDEIDDIVCTYCGHTESTGACFYCNPD